MRYVAIAVTLGFAALIASLAAAQQQAADPQVAEDAGRAADARAVREMQDQYEAGFNAGDAAEVARLYAEDAVILPPGAERAEGRAAIGRFWQSNIQERGLSDVVVESTEIRRIGEALYDLGTYHMTARGPEGERVKVGGDYMVLLEPGEDRQWQLARHIWNQDAPRRSQ